MFSGYPLMADPENMSWYPLARVFVLFGVGGWNAFVITAYVIASSGMFYFVRTLTRSSVAAATSGIVYGMGGFYMSHLDHTTFIHGAAWLPLIVLGLKRLQTSSDASWIIVTALAVSLCITGGHPQIWVYSLGFACLFSVVTGWQSGPRYLLVCALAVMLGLGVGAVQLVPTTQLWANSTRSAITFEFFNSIHLPPKQLVTLLFPGLFGVGQDSTAVSPYLEDFGGDNVSELAGYVGVLPLVLAIVAARSRRKDGHVRFWIAAAVVSLLLAIGKPLALLMYYVPPYNSFRAPARYLLIFTFSVSVLSGLGIAALDAEPRDRRLRLAVFGVLVVAALFVAGLAVVAVSAPTLFEPVWNSASTWMAMPWRNPALGIPVVALAASATSLDLRASWSGRWTSSVMVGVLVLDSATFGGTAHGALFHLTGRCSRYPRSSKATEMRSRERVRECGGFP